MTDDITDNIRDLMKTMITASDAQDIANDYNVPEPFLRFINHEITRYIMMGSPATTVCGYMPDSAVSSVITVLNKLGYDVDHRCMKGRRNLQQLTITWDRNMRKLPEQEGVRRYLGDTFPGDGL